MKKYRVIRFARYNGKSYLREKLINEIMTRYPRNILVKNNYIVIQLPSETQAKQKKWRRKK